MHRAAGFRMLWCAAALALGMGTADVHPLAYAATAQAYPRYALPYRTASAQIRTDLERMLLDLVNGERAAAGIPRLVPHAGLQRAARVHAQEMFAYGYLSHRSLDGLTPTARVVREGVHGRQVGENVAYAADVRSVHRSIMASVPHRRNVLSAQYALAGVAVADGGAFGIVAVQVFSDAP